MLRLCGYKLEFCTLNGSWFNVGTTWKGNTEQLQWCLHNRKNTPYVCIFLPKWRKRKKKPWDLIKSSNWERLIN